MCIKIDNGLTFDDFNYCYLKNKQTSIKITYFKVILSCSLITSYCYQAFAHAHTFLNSNLSILFGLLHPKNNTISLLSKPMKIHIFFMSLQIIFTLLFQF